MDYVEMHRLSRVGETDRASCATRLRAARISTGMMQKEFAKKFGINQTTYNSQEKGASNPSFAVMTSLYTFFGVDYNFIIAGHFRQLEPSVQEKLFHALKEQCEI